MSSSVVGRKLYLAPEDGVLKGVCAGLAHYFGVPVNLIRVMCILSIFFGLFGLTIVGYIILSFMLKPAPANSFDRGSRLSPRLLLDEADRELKTSEQRLRQIERYVTSETFSVRSRFREL